jgi:hypothetical protein
MQGMQRYKDARYRDADVGTHDLGHRIQGYRVRGCGVTGFDTVDRQDQCLCDLLRLGVIGGAGGD